MARVRKELEQAERRYKRQQQSLALQHQLHLAELEEIHSEKQKQLVDQESLKMGQLMDTFKKQLEAKEDELASRKKVRRWERVGWEGILVQRCATVKRRKISFSSK